MLKCLLIALILFVASSAARAQQANAHDYEGTYGGLYKANQGITRVVIVIEALTDFEVTARYVFYPDNSNHNVPSGEYLLRGTVDNKTGRLVLVANQWVEQPKGYVMADVAATLAGDRQTLTGMVYLHADMTKKWDFKAARWSRAQ